MILQKTNRPLNRRPGMKRCWKTERKHAHPAAQLYLNGMIQKKESERMLHASKAPWCCRERYWGRISILWKIGSRPWGILSGFPVFRHWFFCLLWRHPSNHIRPSSPSLQAFPFCCLLSGKWKYCSSESRSWLSASSKLDEEKTGIETGQRCWQITQPIITISPGPRDLVWLMKKVIIAL